MKKSLMNSLIQTKRPSTNVYLSTYHFHCWCYSERLEADTRFDKQSPRVEQNPLDSMPVTKCYLFSVMECGELLCRVTIGSTQAKMSPGRSVSHCTFASKDQQQQGQEKWNTDHVIRFSDLGDLWVIRIKKPMILCARSTSRSREHSTKCRSSSEKV